MRKKIIPERILVQIGILIRVGIQVRVEIQNPSQNSCLKRGRCCNADTSLAAMRLDQACSHEATPVSRYEAYTSLTLRG